MKKHPLTPRITALTKSIDAACRQGAFPAAQSCIIKDGELLHLSSHGRDHRGRSIDDETRFDIASVTKIAATTLATAILIARRAISLETRISSIIPTFSGMNKEDVTVRELLAHGSGLPAWEPLFLKTPWLYSRDRRVDPRRFDESWPIIVMGALDAPITATRGTRVYSDLGFIILGVVIEAVSGTLLHRFCQAEIYEKLGLERTGFIDLRSSSVAGDAARFAPTGLTRPREPAPGQEGLYPVPIQLERPDPGHVDDDNAWALGGVAGHAGLFSTAQDLAKLGMMIIEELEGSARLGAGEILRQFIKPDDETRGSRRGLGFDLPALEGSAAGALIGKGGPRGAIGHLGFTGCSLWIDLDRKLSVSLLTNRTFPTRANVDGIRAFRPRLHDLVVEQLDQR